MIFLPSLRDIPDPKMPEYVDELLLYIDNNLDALRSVCQFVENGKEIEPDRAASELRQHLYRPFGGLLTAVRRGSHPEDAEHFCNALQELLDTDEPYARSYAYWRQVLRHYRVMNEESKPRANTAADIYWQQVLQNYRKAGEAAAAIPSPKAFGGKRVITDEVRAVLAKATFNPEDKRVDLVKEDLGQLYPQVAAVMRDYDGKWNTKKRTHVFPSSTAVLELKQALEAGLSVNQRTKKQAFYTPESLAAQMARMLQIKPEDRVLEPSAGYGALAKAANRFTVNVDCIENDPEAVKHLRAFSYRVVEADFLSVDPPSDKYDKVIMNPPFAKGQDIKHVLHAFEFLKPGGVLVSVMSSSVLTATTKAARQFRSVINKHGSVTILAYGTFKKSGTNVAAILVMLRKPSEQHEQERKVDHVQSTTERREAAGEASPSPGPTTGS